MRFSDTPNKRVQDGIKLPWLCADCEQRFSAWERKFANEVVVPWSDGTDRTQYADWFLKFCVSVSWRVLHFTKGYNPAHSYSAEEEALIDTVERTWREFLLGHRPHPGQFEQHFIIFDVASSTTIPNLPDNFNRFMVGAVMMDLVGSERSSYTWAKLGKFQIFGTIKHGSNRWEGTKVHVREGVLKPGRFVLPPGLIDLYRQKAEIVRNAHASMSPQQAAKVEAEAMANIDKFVQSRTFRAMRADADMFGEQAIIRKPRS